MEKRESGKAKGELCYNCYMHTFGLFTGIERREIELGYREGGTPLIKPIRSDLLLMCVPEEKEERKNPTPRERERG